MYQIDPMSTVPIYQQIIDQTCTFIIRGILQPGMQLPSVRTLSVNHSVNPRTVLRAYGQMTDDGLISVIPGKGYFILEQAKSSIALKYKAKQEEMRRLCEELAYAGYTEEELIEMIHHVFAERSSK